MIDAHELHPGATVEGRYRIVEELGAGGMGTVFKAIDLRSRSFVALKVLHRHLSSNSERLRRFSRELVAMDRVSSPHVARSVRSGRDGRNHFLVIEYVDGRSLREIIDERSELPAEEALLLAYQVTRALEAAHLEGIIHRDIKPQNIMISSDGFVRVIDFGIARIADDLASAASAGAWGTAEYLAPEVAQGTWDERSDLYSLGAVLYEMSTGTPPFRGSTPWQVELARGEQPSLSDEQCSRLPPALVDLTARLLARDPSQRPAAASAVRAEIEDLSPDIATRIPTPPSAAQGPSFVPYLLGAVGSSRRVIGLLGAALILVVASGLILAGRAGSSGAEDEPRALLAELRTPSRTATQGPMPTAFVSPVGTRALSPTEDATAGSNSVRVPGTVVPSSPSSSASTANSAEATVQATQLTPAIGTMPMTPTVGTIPSRTPRPETSTPVPTPTQLPALRAVHTFPPIGTPLEQGALVSIRAEFEPGRADSIYIEWRDDQCVGQSASYALTPADSQKEFASISSSASLPTLSLVVVRLLRSGGIVAEQTLGGC